MTSRNLKHTITAPSGVFYNNAKMTRTYVSRRNKRMPFTVIYSLDSGKTWNINSWHSRRDLAEKERRRLGYEGYVTAQAVIVKPKIEKNGE